MHATCIFCKIVGGQIPSTRIFEDEHTLAFMDIRPVVKGHALVIPKIHCESLRDAPPEALSRTILTAQKVARAQLNGLSAEGVNIFHATGAAAGQVVPHLHLHVVPRFTTDGHHWNWKTVNYNNPDEMTEWAARIRSGFPEKR